MGRYVELIVIIVIDTHGNQLKVLLLLKKDGATFIFSSLYYLIQALMVAH